MEPEQPEQPDEADHLRGVAHDFSTPKRQKVMRDTTLYEWCAARRHTRTTEKARTRRMHWNDEMIRACDPPPRENGTPRDAILSSDDEREEDDVQSHAPYIHSPPSPTRSLVGASNGASHGEPFKARIMQTKLSEQARWEITRWKGGNRFYRTSFVSHAGCVAVPWLPKQPAAELFGDCAKCLAGTGPIMDYTPCPLTRAKACDIFMNAVDEWKNANAIGNVSASAIARKRVEALRNPLCAPCTERSRAEAQAKAQTRLMHYQKLKERCVANNGCQNPECPVGGKSAWRVLREFRNPRSFSEVSKWICACCHALESVPDPFEGLDTMQSEKLSYVHSVMHDRGSCNSCQRPVIEGQEHAFQFIHANPKCKKFSIDYVIKQQDHGSRLENIANVLDAELVLCKLECANCVADDEFKRTRRVCN